MKNKVKILIENILKESVEENKSKIKLVSLWQDRADKKLKQYEKILAQEVINGNLNLSKAPIENLGNIKHIKGHLLIDFCNNLRYLPENLTVEGGFILRDCSKLKSFPKNLTVGNKLFIATVNLNKLTDEKLIVKEEITLVRCKIDFVNSIKERYPLTTRDFHTIYK
jgi:hypothetical protein